MSELTGLEMIENAQYNLQTVARTNPALAAHPIFVLAMEQLENGLAALEAEEEEAQR